MIVAGVDPLHDLPDSLGLARRAGQGRTRSGARQFSQRYGYCRRLDPGCGHVSGGLGRRHFSSRKRETVRYIAAAGPETPVRHAVGYRYRPSARAAGRRGRWPRALPHEDAEAYTRAEWATAWNSLGLEGDFDAGFRQVQQQGVWVADLAEGMADRLSTRGARRPRRRPKPGLPVTNRNFPFVLHPFQTPGLREGKGPGCPGYRNFRTPQTSVAYGSSGGTEPGHGGRTGSQGR